MNKKHIITSGCSYSDAGSDCWPKFIKDYYDFENELCGLDYIFDDYKELRKIGRASCRERV